MHISRADLGKVLELAQLDAENFRASYGGRAMYGDRCAALIGSHADLMRFTAAAVEVLGRPTIHVIAGRTRVDAMGTDKIFYWPGVEVEELV